MIGGRGQDVKPGRCVSQRLLTSCCIIQSIESYLPSSYSANHCILPGISFYVAHVRGEVSQEETERRRALGLPASYTRGDRLATLCTAPIHCSGADSGAGGSSSRSLLLAQGHLQMQMCQRIRRQWLLLWP